MDVPKTDEELVEHITRLVMDDQPLNRAIDLYARAIQGFTLEDDVSDSETYWDSYHTRLVDMVLRAVQTWYFPPKQEELVF